MSTINHEKMSSKTKYRVTKNGSWQPYIPAVGVASGCRPGARNSSEAFNIAYLADKYQDDRLRKSREGQSIPVAAGSSFEGSSVIPNSNQDRESVLAPVEHRNSGSLEAGLLPRQTEIADVTGRPHRGKITQESATVTLPVTTDQSRISFRYGTNAETLRPPDNLAPGLRPYQEFSMPPRSISTHSYHVGAISNLAPGLIPVESSHATDGDRHDNQSELPEITYKRVYGLNTH